MTVSDFGVRCGETWSNNHWIDLYGPSIVMDNPTTDGAVNGVIDNIRTRTVIHLSFCDVIPAYGPISDMAFGLARNGVRQLVVAHLTLAQHVTGSTGS